MTSTVSACSGCGYDLRAHADDGACPECGLKVEESRRQAALRRRLTWRDSDPRWRRRIVAGVWVLVFIPLMCVLKATGIAAALPVLGFFIIHNDSRTLDDTLLASFGVFEPLMFCIGTGLLFAKERKRQLTRFDWTRRWGLLCSYVTMLLSAASMLFIAALVGVGIAMLFFSMPPRYAPGGTMILLKASATYLKYGPQEGSLAAPFRVIFSSTAVLMACAPLYDALRRTGVKRLAAIAVVPLATFSVVQCLLAMVSYFQPLGMQFVERFLYIVYFYPHVLFADVDPWVTHSPNILFLIELIKWVDVLMVAVWLTIAAVIQRRSPSIL